MKIKPNTWYKIPYYNGYEICFVNNYPELYANNEACKVNLYGQDCLVSLISFKNFKKYPYGYYLPYYHRQKGGKGSYYYELSDVSNKRKRLKINEIISLIEDSGLNLVSGINTLHYGSRNRIVHTTEEKPITLSSTMNSLITSTNTDKEKTMKDVLIFY